MLFSIPCPHLTVNKAVAESVFTSYNKTIMTMFEAIILGLIQGVTEFLPISSTGHLVLGRIVLGLPVENTLAFDVVLQLATILAVMVYFSSDLWSLMQTALRRLGRLPVNRRDETLLLALLVGTIPAVVLGLSLQSFIENHTRSPLFVAATLFAGSILFIYAEWYYHNQPQTNEISLKKGFRIGLFQALALLPGMSRSGATIVGGMLSGLSREEAARFSFLLAIPVIAGAGLKMFLELIQADVTVDWGSLAIGSLVSFGSGLLAIRFLMGFVRSHTLWPFIWYRIILAGFVVFVFVFGQ